MYENEMTTGALNASRQERQRLAQQSLEYNLRNPMFKELFPEYKTEFENRVEQEKVGKLVTSMLRSLRFNPYAPWATMQCYLLDRGFQADCDSEHDKTRLPRKLCLFEVPVCWCAKWATALHVQGLVYAQSCVHLVALKSWHESYPS